ncbi:hypothetical protein B0H13DRAFT_1864975 [Mycena leptocephala]|nr:hypothetical protein B0H13DRAFT_1864975 [Mycena leptocephala]
MSQPNEPPAFMSQPIQPPPSSEEFNFTEDYSSFSPSVFDSLACLNNSVNPNLIMPDPFVSPPPIVSYHEESPERQTSSPEHESWSSPERQPSTPIDEHERRQNKAPLLQEPNDPPFALPPQAMHQARAANIMPEIPAPAAGPPKRNGKQKVVPLLRLRAKAPPPPAVMPPLPPALSNSDESAAAGPSNKINGKRKAAPPPPPQNTALPPLLPPPPPQNAAPPPPPARAPSPPPPPPPPPAPTSDHTAVHLVGQKKNGPPAMGELARPPIKTKPKAAPSRASQDASTSHGGPVPSAPAPAPPLIQPKPQPAPSRASRDASTSCSRPAPAPPPDSAKVTASPIMRIARRFCVARQTCAFVPRTLHTCSSTGGIYAPTHPSGGLSRQIHRVSCPGITPAPSPPPQEEVLVQEAPRCAPSVPPFSPSRHIRCPKPQDESPVRPLSFFKLPPLQEVTQGVAEAHAEVAEVDQDAEVAEVNQDAEAEEEEVDEEADAEVEFIYEPAKSGRPTKEHVAAVRECRRQVLNLIRELAEEHTISPARMLDEVTSVFSGASSRIRNPWNLYCKMATHPDWSTAEIQRLNPDFDPASHELPALSSKHLSAMYQGFQQEYAANNEYLKILEDFHSLHSLTAETKLYQRQRRVTSAANKIEQMLVELRDSDKVEILSLLPSSSVGRAVADDLLGMAKSFVYSHHLGELANDGLVDETSSTKPSASRLTRRAASSSKPSTTRASSSRAATDTLDLDLDTKTVDGKLSRSQADTVLNDQVRLRYSNACQDDVGEDLIRRGGQLRWKTSVARIQNQGYIITGFPSDIRLPAESVDRKGTNSWRIHDCSALTMALDARSKPAQGFRFEEVADELKNSDIIVFTHDYSIPPPDGPRDSPAVIEYWRTSSGKHLPAQDGNGKLWMVKYDLDRGNGRVLSKLPHVKNLAVQPAPEEVEAEPQRRPRAASSKSKKAKGKAKAVEDNEPEDEEPFSPLPAHKPLLRKAQEGGLAKRQVAFSLYRDDSEDEVDELSDLSKYQASCSPSPRTSARTSTTSAVHTGGRKHKQSDALAAPPAKRPCNNESQHACDDESQHDHIKTSDRTHNDPYRTRNDNCATETSAERKRRQPSGNDGVVKCPRYEEREKPWVERHPVNRSCKEQENPTHQQYGGLSRSFLAAPNEHPRPVPRPAHRNAAPPAAPAHAPPAHRNAAPPAAPTHAPPAPPANAAAPPMDYAAMLATLSPEALAAGLTHAFQHMQQQPPQ